mgnify:CR=1 FL=1
MDYDIGYKKPPPGFQPGNKLAVGKGRPRESLTDILRVYLEANNGEKKTRIIQELVKIASNPPPKTQLPAIQMIYERLDGKVVEKHEIKSLVIHVGNEYAQLALEANRLALEESKITFLESEDATKQG